MKKFLKLAAITFFFSVPLPVMSHLAHAQGVALGCGKTKDILKTISDTFKEVPLGVGINKENELVSVFVSEEGAFSIVVTNPNGVSCVRSSGTDWLTEKPKFGRSS